MLNRARKQARKAIESLYEHTCIITEYQAIKDPVTKRNTQKEVVVLENQPCRLSFKTINVVGEGNVSRVSQITKLFISPEIKVKPGSKVTVIQNGSATDYKNSSEPAVYANHQEIVLDIFKDWA